MHVLPTPIAFAIPYGSSPIEPDLGNSPPKPGTRNSEHKLDSYLDLPRVEDLSGPSKELSVDPRCRLKKVNSIEEVEELYPKLNMRLFT
jgi:hypothetical protein